MSTGRRHGLDDECTTFDGREWTLHREAPDFTPLDFHQRWLGVVGDGGDTIEGRWETSPDGGVWELDFGLSYHRIGV